MTQIQLRRDTSTNWSTNNPTPASGEPCYETDTGKLKVGNGTTPYNDLEYIGNDGGETYTLPPATADTLGGVKVGNNLSITDDGTLSATSSTPSNMVTTDTDQTITGLKNFQGGIAFQNTSGGTSSFSIWGDSKSNLLIGGFGHTFHQLLLDASNKIILKAPTVTIGDSGAQITNGDNQAFINTGNFATLAPTGALKYWTGTEADYTAINTKDPDTLYRTTDTNKVFLGTIQLGG